MRLWQVPSIGTRAGLSIFDRHPGGSVYARMSLQQQQEGLDRLAPSFDSLARFKVSLDQAQAWYRAPVPAFSPCENADVAPFTAGLSIESAWISERHPPTARLVVEAVWRAVLASGSGVGVSSAKRAETRSPPPLLPQLREAISGCFSRGPSDALYVRCLQV
jgi:hypothetical protein